MLDLVQDQAVGHRLAEAVEVAGTVGMGVLALSRAPVETTVLLLLHQLQTRAQTRTRLHQALLGTLLPTMQLLARTTTLPARLLQLPVGPTTLALQIPTTTTV